MSRLTELIKYHEQHAEDLAESYGIATEYMEMGEVKAYAGHCQRQEDTLTYLKELQRYKDLEEQGRLIVLPVATGEPIFEVQKGNIVQHSLSRNWRIVRYLDEGIFGVIAFTTKEEAEARLEELKGEKK